MEIDSALEGLERTLDDLEDGKIDEDNLIKTIGSILSGGLSELKGEMVNVMTRYGYSKSRALEILGDARIIRPEINPRRVEFDWQNKHDHLEEILEFFRQERLKLLQLEEKPDRTTVAELIRHARSFSAEMDGFNVLCRNLYFFDTQARNRTRIIAEGIRRLESLIEGLRSSIEGLTHSHEQFEADWLRYLKRFTDWILTDMEELMNSFGRMQGFIYPLAEEIFDRTQRPPPASTMPNEKAKKSPHDEGIIWEK